MNQQPELALVQPILRQGQPHIRSLRDFAAFGVGEKIDPPEDFVRAVEYAASQSTTPALAQQALDRYLPDIPRFRPHVRLYVALGTLTEKLRQPSGMLAFWADLNGLFPTDETALRLMMRWYRRTRQLDEGRQRLCQLCAGFGQDAAQAQKMALGYQELHAYSDLDAMLQSAAPSDRLHGIYVEALVAQQRFTEALTWCDQLEDLAILRPALRKTLDTARADSPKMDGHNVRNAFDVMGKMVDAYANRPPQKRTELAETGRVVFFTGQLGMGGAERQMTRLAARLQARYEDKADVAGDTVTRPPLVCVRHATPSSRSDFFLPVLKKAGVSTTVLADVDDPGVDVLSDAPKIVRDLFYQLPEDIQQNTCKLVRYFRANKVDVAYLWQDGGVLTAALAAIVAGVPRIVATFRGMPPNHRPELFRPQMTALNIALNRLPWVVLTTNSARTAGAYERWLGLPEGRIKVIHNAVEPLSPLGDTNDVKIWAHIKRVSPDCTQTVLGVFRFDQNKRPALWIDAAAAYLKTRPTTRFVLIGGGHEWQTCHDKVTRLGLQNRIFLCGASTHVGFYMHRSDLLLHLARFEGLPNSLIEAAFCGLPAITTPAGGAAEVVQHGQTGLVLDNADAVDIPSVHRALDCLLEDHETRQRLAITAQKHARETFDMPRILQQTLKLFR